MPQSVFFVLRHLLNSFLCTSPESVDDLCPLVLVLFDGLYPSPLVTENVSKVLADTVFNFPIVLFVQLFHHLVYVAQLLLILLFLTDPEQIFIELCKFLKDGPFLEIFFVILSDFDDRVDDPHDERGVVTVFLKEDRLGFHSQYLSFLS